MYRLGIAIITRCNNVFQFVVDKLGCELLVAHVHRTYRVDCFVDAVPLELDTIILSTHCDAFTSMLLTTSLRSHHHHLAVEHQATISAAEDISFSLLRQVTRTLVSTNRVVFLRAAARNQGSSCSYTSQHTLPLLTHS